MKLRIDKEVCDECNKQHKYNEEIREKFDKRFPDYDNTPEERADYYDHLYDSYKTNCLVVEAYEDETYRVCEKHIMPYINHLRDANLGRS